MNRTHDFRPMDGNQAAADVAYRTNEVVALYPITPSSPMGEYSDACASAGIANLWGTVPEVIEMQSEGGVAGAIHGALQTGALATTFTSSQGLLLMIPNMYKIAGELTPTVIHVASRSLATQGLSIFGDHSDVMAARSCGWAMLFGSSVQEAMDLALVAQAATLQSRIPFLHIFDGFRTSHEIQKIDRLSDDDLRALIDLDGIAGLRDRRLSPDRPFIRGTAQNPDVYFQARESVNGFYRAVPQIVRQQMDALGERTGRRYGLFDYVGAADAERVLVLMGSGCDTAEETVEHLVAGGQKVGLVKVRLYRPFSVEDLAAALPQSVRRLAVLDRTKEPGAVGEPLYGDVVTALHETGRASIEVIGGRYGLSSKEFTPAMVAGVFAELDRKRPKNHFTVGIVDDVTHTSIDYDADFDLEPEGTTRAVFWGLGSDGTVGAAKNTVKIISETTDLHAQAYFVYDSRKAGARTISHVRFGKKPIRSRYLIRAAEFVGVHQFGFLERYDPLQLAARGATVLLNSPHPAESVWDKLPRVVQRQIIEKELKLHVVDAHAIARENGLGSRINTIMQACYFALSDLLPAEEALTMIKRSIEKTYRSRGLPIVGRNFAAVDAAGAALAEVEVPSEATSRLPMLPPVPEAAPEFVQQVTAEIIAGRGDDLPVSALPADGTYPSGTTRWEKRDLAQQVPEWESDICIQCGKCVMICPHSVIRAKVVDEGSLQAAPDGFETVPARWRGSEEKRYTLQVSHADCTGCTLCVEVCPVKDKSHVGRKALNMVPRNGDRTAGDGHWDFFEALPGTVMDPSPRTAKEVQLFDPLFEFPSACAGCGETPYLRLMSQLFGERALIANATGCSSIYGGNLPTTPWSVNREGRGPAWSNSLFEDNAEFGLGMRITLDKQRAYARELVGSLRGTLGPELSETLTRGGDIDSARRGVEQLKQKIAGLDEPAARDLTALADTLVDKSVWIVGGDGWAYDIGFAGLDHVLASGRNVNVLVLNTEVYSNTGGQASKATGLGAVAKFAAAGKDLPKKDLGLLAMSYGHIYVAQVALGADDKQTLHAFREAEAYQGPSLIIAYSHCIAHGYDMAHGVEQQRRAVHSGHWLLYRFDPARKADGVNPLQLDSKAPSIPLKDFFYNENRYGVLRQSDPERAARLLDEAQRVARRRWDHYEQMAAMDYSEFKKGG